MRRTQFGFQWGANPHAAKTGGDALAEWMPNNRSEVTLDHSDDARGWQQIDTYLEHHYFMVEAGEDAKAADPFANDTFQFDIFVRRQGSSGKISPDPKDREPSNLDTPLFNWFMAFRAAQSGKPVAKPPTAITLPALVDSLIYWLASRDATNLPSLPDAEKQRGGEILLQSSPGSPPPTDDPDFSVNYSYAFKSKTLQPVKEKSPSADTKVGAVVACTMLEPHETGSGATTPAGKTRIKHILRVSILADPWSRIVLRARILRNVRGVAHAASDIDPAFTMPSDYSHLNGYAREKVVLDFDAGRQDTPVDAPLEQSRLLIETVTLKEWLEKRFTSPPQIGKIVEKRIRSKVPSGPLANAPMWTASEMLDSPGRRAVAILRQPESYST